MITRCVSHQKCEGSSAECSPDWRHIFVCRSRRSSTQEQKPKRYETSVKEAAIGIEAIVGVVLGDDRGGKSMHGDQEDWRE